MITKMRMLLHQDMNVRIRHIYREADMPVDMLAKNGRSQLTNMCIFEKCPSCLNQLLDRNLYESHIPCLISL